MNEYDIDLVTITKDDEGMQRIVEVGDLGRRHACEAPSPGDVVLLQGVNYRVAYAAWDYDNEHVRVVVRDIAIGDAL